MAIYTSKELKIGREVGHKFGGFGWGAVGWGSTFSASEFTLIQASTFDYGAREF